MKTRLNVLILAMLFSSMVVAISAQTKHSVETPDAPNAIGPYSQAIVANGFVYSAGQVGADPKTGALVGGGITEQTEQVLKNITAVLKAAGTGLDSVVKTTVFLADMNDFAKMNEVYAKFFKKPYPARSTVQVARLPRDARVEIEAVAVIRQYR
ncbi:MAG TPA: RidA family protein [Pyrinomonadaceae bacterium]|nr:RidA family protein [Pyrinomonadaceae bacterium]